MTDFAGARPQIIGPGGPFPDPLVGLPKIPDAAIGGGPGIPYPAGPFDPITAIPGLVPFERAGSGGLKALGVDPQDLGNQGDGQSGSGAGGIVQATNATFPSADHAGARPPGVDVDWFGRWIVFPGRLDLGNVLTSQIRTLELINTFRREARTWEAFVNNAGAGVSATNLPGLPLVLEGLDSFILNIQVTTDGPPTIDGTLDFDVDLTPPDILEVPITGNRISMFQYRPQTPIREKLEFETDIIEHNDGSEQRINVRRAPRQRISFKVRTGDDRTRDSINALLYDWQTRIFGVPIWWEAKELGVPLAINDTTVIVDTANADFREGGLVMIYDTNFAFETLEILTVNPNDIELQSGIVQAFDTIDTVVVPVRTAFTKPQLNQARFAIGPTDFALEFLTLDNIDLADATTFPTYQGAGQTIAKPVIDRLNFMSGRTITEGNRKRAVVLDPGTGPETRFSPWPKSKPLYNYGFEAKTFAETWEFRQLFHFLRGSQTSFYVGTGRTDFKVVVDIPDTSTQIDFQAFGFTQFVQQVTPRSDLQIFRKDGTTSIHEITGSVEVSASVERITVSPGISPALDIIDIDRIEFLTLNRIASDEAVFSHSRPGESRIDISLLGVPS